MSEVTTSNSVEPDSTSSDQPCGVYKNLRLMHVCTSIVGYVVHVQTKDGKIWEGIFTTFNPQFTICLDYAVQINSIEGKKHCLYAALTEGKQVVRRQAFFELKDIVRLTVTDVDLNYATTSLHLNHNHSKLATDADISGFDGSKSIGSGDRQLETWQDDSDNASADQFLSLDEVAASGSQDGQNNQAAGWDASEMFRFNEEVHNVKTTFTADMPEYTVPLSSSSKDWRKKREKAEAIAKEIESNGKSQSRLAKEDDDGEDEEEKFSAVVRQVRRGPSNNNHKLNRNRQFQQRSFVEFSNKLNIPSPRPTYQSQQKPQTQPTNPQQKQRTQQDQQSQQSLQSHHSQMQPSNLQQKHRIHQDQQPQQSQQPHQSPMQSSNPQQKQRTHQDQQPQQSQQPQQPHQSPMQSSNPQQKQRTQQDQQPQQSQQPQQPQQSPMQPSNPQQKQRTQQDQQPQQPQQSQQSQQSQQPQQPNPQPQPPPPQQPHHQQQQHQSEIARKSKLNPDAKEFVYKPRSRAANQGPTAVNQVGLANDQAASSSPISQGPHNPYYTQVPIFPHGLSPHQQQHHAAQFMPNHAHFQSQIHYMSPMAPHFPQQMPQRYVRNNFQNYHHRGEHHNNVRPDYPQGSMVPPTSSGQQFVPSPATTHHPMNAYPGSPQQPPMIYSGPPQSMYPVVQAGFPQHLHPTVMPNPPPYDGSSVYMPPQNYTIM